MVNDNSKLEEDTQNPNPFLYTEQTVEEEDDGHIAKPFDPLLIDIDTKQPTVSNVIEQIINKELDLTPAFQREKNLWDVGKQSRLIESILLHIPLPAFYFDVESHKNEDDVLINTWQVIDGLQRLCSIQNFILGRQASPTASPVLMQLQNLEFLTQLNGKTFADLPRPYQRTILETQLIAYLIRPNTPSNVKFNIFKRVNTGGMPLTQQEIRHALNQGIAAEFLQELAHSEHFRNATRKKIDSSRMLDREFVNRFLAFYLLEHATYEDLDSFLNQALKYVTNISVEERNKVRDIFFSALDTIFACFGKYAFCKLDAFPKMKPINKVQFEVLTVSVAKLSPEERKILASKQPLEQFVQLFTKNDKEFTTLISTSTSDKKRITSRYRIIHDFLKENIYA